MLLGSPCGTQHVIKLIFSTPNTSSISIILSPVLLKYTRFSFKILSASNPISFLFFLLFFFFYESLYPMANILDLPRSLTDPFSFLQAKFLNFHRIIVSTNSTGFPMRLIMYQATNVTLFSLKTLFSLLFYCPLFYVKP